MTTISAWGLALEVWGMHSWGLSSFQVLLSVCGQHQTREPFSIAPYPNQVCPGCEQGLSPQHYLSTALASLPWALLNASLGGSCWLVARPAELSSGHSSQQGCLGIREASSWQWGQLRSKVASWKCSEIAIFFLIGFLKFISWFVGAVFEIFLNDAHFHSL